jgi:hypothetical protein
MANANSIRSRIASDAGNILAGHGRLEAAKLLGLEAVPTIRIGELIDSQKRAYVLADNRLAERAGWDRATLALELGELSVLLPDLGLSVDLTGFKVGEIDAILAETRTGNQAKPATPAANADDEPLPETPVPVSRLGDLWRLGRHRLLCGNPRDGAAVQQLMGDERADMIFTAFPIPLAGSSALPFPAPLAAAPPLAPHANNGPHAASPDVRRGADAVGNDGHAYLQLVLQNAARVSRDGAIAFISVDWYQLGELLQTGKAVFGDLKDLVVWDRADGPMGSLYRCVHEPIAVFQVGDGEHVNDVVPSKPPHRRTNIWHYAALNPFKANGNVEFAPHSAVKPVAMIADAVKDVTRRDAIVLDLFGGSGTTLIACERTGRQARLLEREPRQVDVSILRLEKLFKLEAIHAQSGATYSELARSRFSLNISK